jgi:hypothetical protein
MNHQSNHALAHMNWAIPIFLFIAGAWPIGLALVILKLIDSHAEQQEQQRQRDWIDQMNGYAPAGRESQPFAAQAQPAAPQGFGGTFTAPAAPAQPARKAGPTYRAAPVNPDGASAQQRRSLTLHKVAIGALFVFGAVFFLAGFSQMMNVADWIRWGLVDNYLIRYELLPAATQLLGGIGLVFSGTKLRRGIRHEQELATIAGGRSCVSLQELAAASGLGEKKTLSTVRDAISHGMFGAGAYVDMASRTLVVRGAAPRPAAAPAPQPAPQPKAAEAPKQENKYQAILRQLREVNDAIPGEEMSAKISKLEEISARIFALVEKEPAKEAQLNKFMDYYLPTALKLLNTYATLDQQGMDSSKNVTETKASIENAMDLLIKAFEGQLDKLFQDDALDVSGDIAALQGMMHMDGLSGTDFGPHSDKPDEL